jgi:hypothetical protein
MDLNLVAPCGIDCANCELFAANGRRDVWERAASRTGRPVEEMACKGCREGNGCVFFSGCETLACVRSHGVDFCYDCADFPCRRLMPLADGAGFYPHNMKMYNLCRLKAVGFGKFLDEAPEIRKLYYNGKFRIGAGPQDSPTGDTSQ